jgi:hypothetical protein
MAKVDVWTGYVDDRPGALAEKLEAVTDAGANLEFVIARRAPEKKGKGVVFVAPLRGARQTRAAKRAGLSKTSSLLSVRFEARDRPGLGAEVTRALADAGVNMRGFSGTGIGRRCVFHFAFDSEADAQKARRVLKKSFGSA